MVYLFPPTTPMNPQESLDLKKMISEMNCENNTDHIRKLKHSSEIAQNVKTIHEIRTQYPDMPYNDLLAKCQSVCSFLYGNYTDIFHKCVRGELDIGMMSKFLVVLKMIEDGTVDQHEGSVYVGRILKEIYVDSALKRADALDRAAAADAPAPKPKVEAKPISWKEYKASKSAGKS